MVSESIGHEFESLETLLRAKNVHCHYVDLRGSIVFMLPLGDLEASNLNTR